MPTKQKSARRDIPRLVLSLILAKLAAAAGGAGKDERGAHPHEAKRKRGQPAAKSKNPASMSVKRPTWRDWKKIAKRVFKALGDDRLIAVAAGIVFYGLLAFFPAITALVSIYGLIADPSLIGEHLSLASGILPAGGFDIMREQIDRILAKGGGQLSFAFVFGISLAIWSANA
ncbi:MAG TPA: YhjD/YihY/BrkB family envelope integrity protein, partial [Xanthobacteraceae bacterium]|nr:YhjD/YihY/BrkB family envelope integrity protein [Xanthobacteraceae bacterium]